MSQTFKSHVYVCTNSQGEQDKRHCGDKAGLPVWTAFREARKKYNLLDQVMITKSGCTGQHGPCAMDQCVVIIYGPSLASQGTWYRLTEADVDEVFQEHVMNGRIVDRFLNLEVSVKWG